MAGYTNLGEQALEMAMAGMGGDEEVSSASEGEDFFRHGGGHRQEEL